MPPSPMREVTELSAEASAWAEGHVGSGERRPILAPDDLSLSTRNLVGQGLLQGGLHTTYGRQRWDDPGSKPRV